MRRQLIQDDPQAALFACTEQMASQGVPLILRVVPPEAEFRQWTHYPKGDAISPETSARWFYHAHPPEQREPGEHGHFHLFLPLDAFDGETPLATPTKPKKKGKKPAKVVHFAALSCNLDGIPTHWFTTNKWVTNEYFMPADAIIARLGLYDLDGADADPLVNQWLTAAVATYADTIAELLRERDAKLPAGAYEDRDVEILSSAPIEL